MQGAVKHAPCAGSAGLEQPGQRHLQAAMEGDRLRRECLQVLAYSSLINDICRVAMKRETGFPKYMSAYVRECFSRIQFMDPQV
jgi:hypothetical protein